MKQIPQRHSIGHWAIPVLLLVLTGCTSLGPRTVPKDRADYSNAIGDSWKRQTLLNIVKIRYVDPPIFVDVGQVVAGYSFQSSLNVGGTISSEKAVQGNFFNLGGGVIYTDRPTVTYVPLTGNKFVKSLMTPLPVEQVFYTIESGWPADGVLLTAVASINGLKNQNATIAGVTPPDPKFVRVLELMRKIQLSGAVAMRIQLDAAKKSTALLTFRSETITPATLADIHELRSLLGLDQTASEFKLVFGGAAANDHEVAVVTRSLLHIMGMLAAQVTVPADDLAHHRATPGWESAPAPAGFPRLLEIRSSGPQDGTPFVSINYRGHTFWIDDGDLKSKRTFSFMMMMFTLADTGDKENLPQITIPAQ